MAYKLKIKQDMNTAIVFLDAVRIIPTVAKLPNSRELDPDQKKARDSFIETFNFKYSKVADRVEIEETPLIIVKAFYFDEYLKSSPEMELVISSTPEEMEQVEQSLVAGWKRIFNFTEDETQHYLKEYKIRYKSQLN